MKAYICDVCGKTAKPEQYETAPTGWVTAYRSGDILGQQHLCGPVCLLDYAAKANTSKPVEVAHG